MLGNSRPLPPAATAATAAAIAAATAAAIGLSAMPAAAAGADADDRAAPMLEEFRQLEATTSARDTAPLRFSDKSAKGASDGKSDAAVSGKARASSQGLSRSVDWTGFYLGAQVGVISGDSNRDNADEDVVAGITGGYDHDFGQWVLGAGVDYDITEVSVTPNADLEEIFRLKGRAGYKIGRGLLYGTGGFAWADTDRLGDEAGYFFGGGYEYKVTRKFSVGGEVLYHDFGDFDGGTDIDAITFQIRANYRF